MFAKNNLNQISKISFPSGQKHVCFNISWPKPRKFGLKPYQNDGGEIDPTHEK